MWKRFPALMFVAVLAIAAAWLDASAAGADDPFGRDFAARMKESLALTDDQVARLQPVIKTRIDKVDAALAALDSAEKPDVPGFIKGYGDIKREFDAGVMKVLTLDQRKPWESFQAEFEHDLVQAGATKQLFKLQSALKLTDDQVTRLQPAMTTAIQKKLDLFQELTNSGYINVREERQARRALDALNSELEKSITAVLTLDQRNAYKALKSH